jgi:hypothetical protein
MDKPRAAPLSLPPSANLKLCASVPLERVTLEKSTSNKSGSWNIYKFFITAKPIDWAAIRAKLPTEVSDAAKAKREVHCQKYMISNDWYSVRKYEAK